MDITSVENCFYSLAQSVIGVDVDEYLHENEKRLYGLLIVDGGKAVSSMFGDPPEELLAAANARPSNSKAGFCVDVGDELRIDVKGDVLLLGNEMLDESHEQIYAIIVHELTHFAIDSANDNLLSLEITSDDRKVAAELYSRTDRQAEHRTRHNEYFCQMLTVACRRWATDADFLSTQDAIDLAMRFDVDGGFPH